jgi:hypothetical protein
MIKPLLLIISICMFPTLALSQVITFPAAITTIHPRVLVDKDSLTVFKQRVALNPWMATAIQSITGTGSSTTILDYYVNRHQTDSTWIVSRLQMYWKNKYTDVFVSNAKFDHGGGDAAPVPTVRFSGARDWATNFARPSLENITPNSDSLLIRLYNNTTQLWEWTLPKNSGNIIDAINRSILTKARDAAFLYWYTNNEKYAKFAYDIFKTYMYGMYYRNPPQDATANTIIGLQTFEVIHEDQFKLVRTYLRLFV